MPPRATNPSILLGDWKAGRAQQICASLHPPFNVETVDLPRKLVSFFHKEHPHLVILPLCWRNSEAQSLLEECEGYRIVQVLSSTSHPPDIILFDQNIDRFSLNEYCRPFLNHVVAFLDESDPLFAPLLSRKASECLMRFKACRESASSGLFDGLGLVGSSDAMQNIRNFISKAARLSDVPVMVSGESGTGKELIARAIHHLDEKRHNEAFIAVNCSAISKTIAESEFFGHRRGAFTGAVSDRSGYFGAAHRGTLFLDEISELDLSLQPKLLRALQEGMILPVGEEHEREIDIRVIVGTNKNLSSQLSKGAFRLDLFHRINVLSLDVPALRFRKDDIPPLFYYFLNKHQSCYKRPITNIDPQVLNLLLKLDLKGNVRELENITRKILFHKSFGDCIEMMDVPLEIIASAITPSSSREEEATRRFLVERVEGGHSLKEVLVECEELLLQWAYHQVDGNRTEMARKLRTTTRNIFNKMRGTSLKPSAK